MPYDPVHDAVQSEDRTAVTDSDTASEDITQHQPSSSTTTDGLPKMATMKTNGSDPQESNGTLPQFSVITMNSTKPSTAETPVAEQKRGTKHKLTPGKGGTPSKKQKKVHNSVLNSVRSRHLKKFDGQPFWRKDIQYSLLKSLFDNDIKAFTDPFPDSDENVSMDDRELDPRGRLSFAELYIKSIAHSSKCSKVLKDRLLNDMKMSIPTCMICLLVNVGRMNTTINFVPDMKSQLRTYHPIPSLQVNYDSSTTGNDKSNDKQLQDTPRLKSILKACCDDSHEPSTLDALMKRKALPLTTCVNMIFVLCNYEDLVQSEFFEDVNYNFYDIFMNASYNPRSRADLFLWLLWNYLESHRTPEEISKNPFGSEKPLLKPAVMEFDVDTPLEKEFGEKLYEQRIKYLSEESSDKKEKGSEDKKKDDANSSTAFSNSNDSSTNQTNSTSNAHSNGGLTASQQTPQPSVLRQDIDVDKVRTALKALSKNEHRKRIKQGMLQFENSVILKEETGDDDSSMRLRLKNYKGDFGEYATKFNKLFNLLKSDFAELSKEDKQTIEVNYAYNEGSLKLKHFSVDL